MLWMIVLGTIVPFALVVGALRHISATRAGITAMLEPVVAIVVAWAWLGESLAPVQLSGAVLTLMALGSPRPHGEKAALSEFDVPLLGEATPERRLCRLPRC